MAHLMEFRRRIRAIQSIKKISHAMRLVAMSVHSRLRSLEGQLQDYHGLINHLIALFPESDPRAYLLPNHAADRRLVIVVGSQKGLCGSFNTGLVRLYREKIQAKHMVSDIITVGKHIDQLLEGKPIEVIEPLGLKTFVAIAHSLAQHVLDAAGKYQSVLVVSNKSVSFFVQEPYVTSLIPFAPDLQNFDEGLNRKKPSEPYILEQSQQLIERVLRHFIVASQIQSILFDSLTAEQAARFLTMDSATNNAEDIIQQMKIDLNKLRQSAITRELAELTAGL